MNISMPQPMADYVRSVVERDYGNVSEYFRELVRERIGKEIAGSVAFLEKATEGAPAGPSEVELEEVLKIQKRVRKALRARGD